MLYKVTGAGHCECVCEESEGQSSMVHGAKEREGGGDGRELSFLTAWCMKLSFSLLVLAWRLRSLLPDGSRLKKLCDGWVGSPAMQRALRVRRVLEGGERDTNYLLSCSHYPLKGLVAGRVAGSECSRWCLCKRCTWWGPGLWLFWVCGGSRDTAGFLGQCYRVVSPGEVLCDVHTQELGATHSLHSRTFDGQIADYVECWTEVYEQHSDIWVYFVQMCEGSLMMRWCCRPPEQTAVPQLLGLREV